MGRVLGYWKEWDTLTHVVIRDAGHMVPRDDPLTSQASNVAWLVHLELKQMLSRRCIR